MGRIKKDFSRKLIFSLFLSFDFAQEPAQKIGKPAIFLYICGALQMKVKDIGDDAGQYVTDV